MVDVAIKCVSDILSFIAGSLESQLIGLVCDSFVGCRVYRAYQAYEAKLSSMSSISARPSLAQLVERLTQVTYITFASAMWIRQPTLALKPRGDVSRNPKQGYQVIEHIEHVLQNCWVIDLLSIYWKTVALWTLYWFGWYIRASGGAWPNNCSIVQNYDSFWLHALYAQQFCSIGPKGQYCNSFAVQGQMVDRSIVTVLQWMIERSIYCKTVKLSSMYCKTVKLLRILNYLTCSEKLSHYQTLQKVDMLDRFYTMPAVVFYTTQIFYTIYGKQ